MSRWSKVRGEVVVQKERRSFTGITSDGEIHQAPLDKVRGNDYTLMFIEESARLEEGE